MKDFFNLFLLLFPIINLFPLTETTKLKQLILSYNTTCTVTSIEKSASAGEGLREPRRQRDLRADHAGAARRRALPRVRHAARQPAALPVSTPTTPAAHGTVPCTALTLITALSCSGRTACSKCMYATSCYRAMLRHSGYCAGAHALETAPRRAPHSLHCVCGHSTDIGKFKVLLNKIKSTIKLNLKRKYSISTLL